LIEAALKTGVPLLPGVANPSEAMRLLERGITAMKFFPAEAAGGVPMLKFHWCADSTNFILPNWWCQPEEC